jgi:hypothetical protein
MARKKKVRRLLIECEKCGEPFYFYDYHTTREETQANFDWAMMHVTLCHECRPHFVKVHPNTTAGLPGMFGSD